MRRVLYSVLGFALVAVLALVMLVAGTVMRGTNPLHIASVLPPAVQRTRRPRGYSFRRSHSFSRMIPRIILGIQPDSVIERLSCGIGGKSRRGVGKLRVGALFGHCDRKEDR